MGRRGLWRGLLAAGLIVLAPQAAEGDIKRLSRIRKRVEPRLEALFAARGIDYPPKRLFLRAFKLEGELEMWASHSAGQPMKLVKRYPICAKSGDLGPKRRQGDLQVPEGAYQIHRYNAWSAYHLSLRVNYPNASDRVRGKRYNLGGAIMVHGDCVTIGCIPIEDRPIEEVFVSTLDASRAGRARVPIHIFPARLTSKMLAKLADAGHAKEKLDLWRELKPIYDAFEADRVVPMVTIDPKTGAYSVAAQPRP